MKLVLWELCYCHNEETGMCNPSKELLAHRTGLSPEQIHQAIMGLIAKEIIVRDGQTFRFTVMMKASDRVGVEIPDSYWPSEETISDLVAMFPQHDFSIGEIVNDFIAFARRRHILFKPDTFDAAFHRNARSILQRRKPGRVKVGSSPDRSAKPSQADSFLGHNVSGG
jgi:hypothetical protein